MELGMPEHIEMLGFPGMAAILPQSKSHQTPAIVAPARI
jgi:hypothetical protein